MSGAVGESWWSRPIVVLGGVAAVCAGVPFALALGVLHQPRWYPVLDIAQIELRVRDVGTADRPLVGLAGRIHGLGVQGSHPGPLGFWVLWPLYKLFGGTAWALQAATATLNAVAVTIVLWLVQRRGGTSALLGGAMAMAFVMRTYGFEKLTVPWNPFLPLLWWIVFLVAVWSVLSDDLVALPVAVFAGSLCAQTHVSYIPVVTGVAVAATVATAVRAARRDLPDLRRLAAWAGASVGLLVLLWVPPVIEQRSGDPGNLSVIRDAFAHPTGGSLGMGRQTLRIWLSYLDVWGLLRPYQQTGQLRDGEAILGIVALVVWAGAFLGAWRLRHRQLLNLHLVVAMALACGLVAISRIFNGPWFSLALWSWGTTTLLVAATAGTALVALGRTDRLAMPQRNVVVGYGALVAVALLVNSGAHAHVNPVEARDSRTVAHIVPGTVAALERDREGRYLVRFEEDPFDVGATGQGLFLELERQGFDVGVPERFAPDMTSPRVLRPEDATAVIHQVVGTEAIERWRANPDAEQVAFYDPRTPDEVRRYERGLDHVADELERTGHTDLVSRLAFAPLAIAINPSVPLDIREELSVLLAMGHPTAVFLAPLSSQDSAP